MIALKYKKLSGLFLIFSVVYLAQSALIKPDKAALAKYHISVAQAIALTMTIAIPYLVIWFIALVGYLRFQSYADSIAHTKDGEAFKVMAQGILLLALWLPLSAIIGDMTSQYYHMHPSATDIMVNLNNYANLLLQFPAFVLLGIGASRLLPLIKRRSTSLPSRAILLGVCLSAAYVFLVFHDPSRQFPTHDASIASYYLPDWATFLTIVIPRLVMWFLGAQAVYTIFLYRRKVKGTLYKSALNNLARGLGGVIVMTIILRSFQSLAGPLSHLSVGFILALLYVLLILLAVGYILIAKGARSLQRIEEL